uniref:MHD1 domain-containing protein n=1 Tax=Macrostomum lignano TaxID=282301 RepID=A0A1I8JH84_9PLAT
MVSGTIRLHINVQISGEENSPPYHLQYACLHETLFHNIYCETHHRDDSDKVDIGGVGSIDASPNFLSAASSGHRGSCVEVAQSWQVYFESNTQEIVEEFARRYGVDRLYQAMTHFSCLTTRLTCPGVPAVLSSLLANINAQLARPTIIDCANAENLGGSAANRLATSNFGRDRFIRLIDQLHNSLRIRLSNYRSAFPASQPDRLRDLKACVDLLTSIAFFRLKVQQSANAPRAAAVLRDCARNCLRATYGFVRDNCPQLSGCSSSSSASSSGAAELNPDSLNFWHRMVELVAAVIDEDRAVYAPVLNQFPQQFQLSELSAIVLWELLCEDLDAVLKQRRQSGENQQPDRRRNGETAAATNTGCEYLNLLIRTQCLYDKYICPLQKRQQQNASQQQQQTTVLPPAFPSWFEPFVLSWLADMETASLEFVRSAYARDRRDGFQRSSEHARFSTSVVDTIAQLGQCHRVLQRLGTADPQVAARQAGRFAESVAKVLREYSQVMRADFVSTWAAGGASTSTARVLLNNAQQLRVQLHQLYESMGGDTELPAESRQLLQGLQEELGESLDAIAGQAATIRASAQEARRALISCGCIETGPARKNSVHQTSTAQQQQLQEAADAVLRPLVDFLDGALELLAADCERAVLRRLLKRLWRVTVRCLEMLVLLPISAGLASRFVAEGLQQGGTTRSPTMAVIEQGGDVNGRAGVSCANASANGAAIHSAAARRWQFWGLVKLIPDSWLTETQRPLTRDQCSVLLVAIETIKQYFHADGHGLKMAYLERSPELRSLRCSLALYSETTDALIKAFVATQASQDSLISAEDKTGEVSVQVDLFKHDATGHVKISVRVVSASDLLWHPLNSFRPYVEVALVGPGCEQGGGVGSKHSFTTRCRKGTDSPKYNELFHFILDPDSDPEWFELQISCRHYRLTGRDRLVGLTVLQLREILDEGSCACWCVLSRRLQRDSIGEAILRVLAQRIEDRVAMQFVRLKCELRLEPQAG